MEDPKYHSLDGKVDDGTVKCTNRLLIMIVGILTVQMVIFGGLMIGILTVYEENKHTVVAISSLPWQSMANDVSAEYAVMDKHAFNAILDNTKNATNAAKNVMYQHATPIAEDVHQMSDKAKENADLIDTMRQLIFTIQQPVNEISKLFTHKGTMDVQVIIELMKEILENMQKTNVHDVVDKLNTLLAPDNTKLLLSLAKDSDDGFKNINKVVKTIEKLKSI